MPLHLATATQNSTVDTTNDPVFFEQTLEAWWCHRRAGGNRDKSIAAEVCALRDFVRIVGKHHWWCARGDADLFGAWCATELCRGTARFKVLTNRHYLEFLTDPADDWVAQCERSCRATPRQLFYRGNTPPHVEDPEGEKRPFSLDELERTFASIRTAIEHAAKTRRKGQKSAARDYALYATQVAYGLRDIAVAGLDLCDLRQVPHPRLRDAYGRIGALEVRCDKAKPHGAAHTHTVYTVPLFTFVVDVLEWYLQEVRPLFGARPTAQDALFLNERGGRCTPAYISRRFERYRRDAQLDEALTPHCFRHTYTTMLLEDGYPQLFVQAQLGHEKLASQGPYTHVRQDFMMRELGHGYAR